MEGKKIRPKEIIKNGIDFFRRERNKITKAFGIVALVATNTIAGAVALDALNRLSLAENRIKDLETGTLINADMILHLVGQDAKQEGSLCHVFRHTAIGQQMAISYDDCEALEEKKIEYWRGIVAQELEKHSVK